MMMLIKKMHTECCFIYVSIVSLLLLAPIFDNIAMSHNVKENWQRRLAFLIVIAFLVPQW